MFGFAWYFEKSVEWVALLIVCTVGFSSPTDGAADEHVIALLDFECCRIYKRLFASLDWELCGSFGFCMMVGGDVVLVMDISVTLCFGWLSRI